MKTATEGRWRRWPRLQKSGEVVAEEARQVKGNAKKRGHHRKRLRSEDVHHLGINMIFLQIKKEGDKRKRR